MSSTAGPSATAVSTTQLGCAALVKAHSDGQLGGNTNNDSNSIGANLGQVCSFGGASGLTSSLGTVDPHAETSHLGQAEVYYVRVRL